MLMFLVLSGLVGSAGLAAQIGTGLASPADQTQSWRRVLRGGIVLGLTFKEDCADLRNSRVIDVVRELQSYGADVIVHDPVAAPAEAMHEYGVDLVSWDRLPKAAAMVAAVSHRAFKARPAADYFERLSPKAVLVDVKSQFNAAEFIANGVTVWRL